MRDRSERLMKLFVTPSSSSAAQAERITTESSRYNIGNLLADGERCRVLALVILDPAQSIALPVQAHRPPTIRCCEPRHREAGDRSG